MSLNALLEASISPDASTRRQAERGIDALQDGEGFGKSALALAQDASQPRHLRQSAALVFKNWCKQNWNPEEAPHTISPTERAFVKNSVLPVMIALASEPALQVQLSEAIGLIAETDFPEHWGELIDVRNRPLLV